jgi:hypothetical protein
MIAQSGYIKNSGLHFVFNYINLILKINILMMQGFKLKHHALVAGSQQPLTLSPYCTCLNTA